MDINKEHIAKLVVEIQNDNQKAFADLYNLTNQRAYFVALEFVKNEADAQDILQESYIKALTKIRELDKPESFQSWLNQIVANKSKDFLKKKKPMLFEAEETEVYEVLPDEDLDFRPQESLDQNELQRTVMEVLDELSEEKRACVLMMYYEEMSVGQIAECLEIPEGTVKTRLFSARKDLKEKFAKRGITSAFSVAPMGVVLWAMRRSCISAGAAFAASSGSAKILAGVTASSASSAAVAASTSTSAKTAGGIGAKIAAMSWAKKVVAGISAAAIIGGATVGAIIVSKNNNDNGNKNNSRGNNISFDESYQSDMDSANISYEENVLEFVPEEKVIEMLEFSENEDGTYTISGSDKNIYGNIRLPAVHKGKRVTSIGEYAFHERNALTGIEMPESIEKIERYAFAVSGISYLKISPNVRTIMDYAFASCHGLNSIILPSGTERIEYAAFYNCQNIETVYIPKTLNYVEIMGFSSIATNGKACGVYYEGTEEEWNSIEIKNPHHQSILDSVTTFNCSFDSETGIIYTVPDRSVSVNIKKLDAKTGYEKLKQDSHICSYYSSVSCLSCYEVTIKVGNEEAVLDKNIHLVFPKGVSSDGLEQTVFINTEGVCRGGRFYMTDEHIASDTAQSSYFIIAEIQ